MKYFTVMLLVVLGACGNEAKDRLNKSRRTEAQLMLRSLSKNAKVYFITNDGFFAGKAGPTPAEPCCKTAGKCPVTKDWQTNPVWAALDFRIDEPNRFQYTYTSDGKTLSATATADLECDGKPITYKLEMSASAAGEVTSNVTEPE